ncbi:hypothetical protein P691DRAFT_679956 [Macrolepiota fuliginosa MF-IS2]|uniref:BTB domain-containing protein n=1 Tax=Macrolepiota fuliginosa MF-IS2 TaxID=1400762 RepID=A0A9P5X5J5_9AGAR|nr:hypothetical protein P691DRAFT_679956 [Macrolepiota fuliginosa MF-IS2]
MKPKRAARSRTSNKSILGVARDPKYYFNDGSITIRVEDRLFKIHRSLFERDSVFFQTLFSLPQGTSADPDDSTCAEGGSDENPITFYNDRVEDFRALCWAIYSRTPDVMAQQDLKSLNIPKLISLVAISHKYEFEVFYNWALHLLEDYSASFPGTLIPKYRRWVNVGRILNLAQQCGSQVLVRHIKREWLAHILNSSTKEESLGAFVEGLKIAESSDGLRRFHRKVYYVYLRATGIFEACLPNNTSALDIGSNPKSYADLSLSQLSDAQKLHMYQGFWSLLQFRIKLSYVPSVAPSHFCPNHTGECIPSWKVWWKGVLDKAERAGNCLSDPGKLLEEVQSDLVVHQIPA